MKKPSETKTLSVIIPAYRQADSIVANVRQIVATLEKTEYAFEVIVVVDGQVDDSFSLLKKAALPHVKCFTYQHNQGKAFAIRFGMHQAVGEYILFIDAGFEIDPAGMEMLLLHMEWYEADVIVGSKRHQASVVNYTTSRKILSYGYYYLVRLLFGLKITDTQAGIKLFRREVLETILPKLVEKRFAGDLEMLVVAKETGFSRIFEAPIKLNYQFSNLTSAATVNSIVGILVDTLAIFYRQKIARYYQFATSPLIQPAEVQSFSHTQLEANSQVQKSKLSVLILNWRDPWHPLAGGAERITLEYAQHWHSKGYEVIWLTNHYPGAKSQEKNHSITYVRVGPYLSGDIFRYLWAYPLFLLSSILKGRKIVVQQPVVLLVDEIHGLPFFSPWWARAEVDRIMLLVCEVAGPIWTKMFPWPVSRLGYLLEKQVYRMYSEHQVVAISSQTADHIQEMNQAISAQVLPMGVNPVPASIQTALKKVKKADRPTLIFLARIVKMKGLESVLNVVPEVLPAVPDLAVQIVGQGSDEYVSELQTTCNQLGISSAVKWVGAVSESKKYQLLAEAHYLLHPSWREGFGLTVLEAGLVGTPSIVRAGSSLDKLVEPAKNGYRFSTEEDLAQLLISVFTEKKALSRYSNLAAQARQLAESHTWADQLSKSGTVTGIE